MSHSLICEACNAEYVPGKGRGHNNRVFCHDCTSSSNIADLRNRNKHLKRSYGLTVYTYWVKLIEQEFKCKACDTELAVQHTQVSRNGKRPPDSPVVDHCHTTNVVRGILCHNCNVAVGHAQDDPARLRRLANYLEEACPIQ